MGQSSSPSKRFDILKNVLDCFCPPRARLILWKFLLNIIPTLANIDRRLRGNKKCFFCGDIDTLFHCFFSCCAVKEIWDNVLNITGISNLGDHECIDWFLHLADTWGRCKLSRIINNMWIIYAARNQCRHDSSIAWWFTVGKNQAYIQAYISSHTNVNQVLGGLTQNPTEYQHIIFISFEVFSFKDQFYQVGGYLKNKEGQMLMAYNKRMKSTCTVQGAVIQAVLIAVDMAINRGYHCICLNNISTLYKDLLFVSRYGDSEEVKSSRLILLNKCNNILSFYSLSVNNNRDFTALLVARIPNLILDNLKLWEGSSILRQICLACEMDC